MADLLDVAKIQLIPVLVIPGFISLKIWTLVNPTGKMKPADQMLDLIVFSLLNYALLFWLVRIAQHAKNVVIAVLVYVLVLVVFPIVWPLVIRKILISKFLKGRIIHPTPRAWDYFFGLGQPCFILVHLRNGKLIGGLYSGDSFASSYPEPQDLYLSETWTVDGKGRFGKRIDQTKGLLIRQDMIDYLELFDTKGE